MKFEAELVEILPHDLPQRDLVIQKASGHLDRIVAANEYMNLTRITTPREAAIKHVLDSLIFHLTQIVICQIRARNAIDSSVCVF